MTQSEVEIWSACACLEKWLVAYDPRRCHCGCGYSVSRRRMLQGNLFHDHDCDHALRKGELVSQTRRERNMIVYRGTERAQLCWKRVQENRLILPIVVAIFLNNILASTSEAFIDALTWSGEETFYSFQEDGETQSE